MAYAFNDLTSLEVLIDHCVAVEAGLAVEGEGLEDLAPAWAALILLLQAARATREEKRHAWIRSMARYRARDAHWDRTIARVSAEAYHLSGKRADQPPYVALFGTIKAREAQSFGAAKATAFGATLAKKLDALEHPGLAGLAEAVRAANGQLEAAGNQRAAAYEDVLLQAITRSRLVRQVNEALARAEADILGRFPGDTERVRALLHPPTRREASEPDAVAPETEAPGEG